MKCKSQLYFTKSRTKNATFKLTIWIHDLVSKIKRKCSHNFKLFNNLKLWEHPRKIFICIKRKVRKCATYNIEIICILTTKSVAKNNIFIKKEGSQYAKAELSFTTHLSCHSHIRVAPIVNIQNHPNCYQHHRPHPYPSCVINHTLIRA